MNDTLRQLRINKKMTQEELAERLDVSRQTIAKWESGESVPDIMRCTHLAEIFDLEIEDIASVFIRRPVEKHFAPKGKYIYGKCVITNNRIVIPDEAMDTFGLKNGDELLLIGDAKRGLALIPISNIDEIVKTIDSSPVLKPDDD